MAATRGVSPPSRGRAPRAGRATPDRRGPRRSALLRGCRCRRRSPRSPRSAPRPPGRSPNRPAGAPPERAGRRGPRRSRRPASRSGGGRARRCPPIGARVLGVGSSVTLARLVAVPPTRTTSTGLHGGAAASAADASRRNAARSVAAGGSPAPTRRVRAAAPSFMPRTSAGEPGPTNANSVLPPPMSTTSRARSTGAPPVTPSSVRSASSSCRRTWTGTPVPASTSPTIRAASASRRSGSVATNVMSRAPWLRAVQA